MRIHVAESPKSLAKGEADTGAKDEFEAGSEAAVVGSGCRIEAKMESRTSPTQRTMPAVEELGECVSVSGMMAAVFFFF